MLDLYAGSGGLGLEAFEKGSKQGESRIHVGLNDDHTREEIRRVRSFGLLLAAALVGTGLSACGPMGDDAGDYWNNNQNNNHDGGADAGVEAAVGCASLDQGAQLGHLDHLL